MSGGTGQIPTKKRGGKFLFSEQIEDAIAHGYFHQDRTAEELREQYGGLSRSGDVSLSAIREIAKRAEKRRIAREAK